MVQYTMSTEYVGNRGFPGTDDFPPGPIGYDCIYFTIGPFKNVYSVMFPLSQWLADGLVVGLVLKSATWMSHMVHSSSYTVAISFFL